MGAIALFAAPQTTAIFVGIVALFVGFIGILFGDGPLALGAFGVFTLCLTATNVIVGAVTIPAGVLMLLGAVAWASGLVHL